MLLSQSAIDTAAELLEPDDFYRESHGTIFRTITTLRQHEKPVDSLLLAAELEKLGVLEKVGGQSRIAELAALVPSTSNVGHYAVIVKDTAERRRLSHLLLETSQANQNGGLALHPEMLDELERAISRARVLPGEPAELAGPVFLEATVFVTRNFRPPEPLLGTAETAIIAEGSLNLLAGRPHTGKTTLILDMACHLAAGLAWPPADPEGRAPTPWPCSRPLRIAIIENEGPQAMFQAKLQDKLERFPHDIQAAGGCILVQAWRWGAFSFADRDAFERARAELDEYEIDLVLGDPLLSLGPEGVGSPRETTDFVQLLRPLGLGTHRAFLFLHHFRERVDKQDDELSRISGAWGGHLDTLITLSATGKQDQARLAYPKIRWARGELPQPLILGRVYNTLSFEALAVEADVGLLEPLIVNLLEEWRQTEQGRGGLGWATETQISKEIGRRRADVGKCLEGAQHLFERAGLAVLHELKAKHNTKLWGLRGWQEPGAPDSPAQGVLDEPNDGIPF